MTDLISRQALCEYALNQKDKSVTPNDIMRFPSAQCMNDSLHRQDVLDEIENWAECGEDKFENAVKALFDRIENMPSEQRTGYWSVESADINTGYGGAIVCSECGRDGGSTYWKYCPYCGARMDAE